MANQNADQDDVARDCLAALAGGAPAAMDRLIAQFGGPITGLLARYLGSDDAARDCAQDVFLTVWRKAASFDPARGSARAWIYAVARNKARDALRRRRLRLVVGLEPFSDSLVSEAPDPERTAIGRDAVASTREAIHDLPDRQRMALLLSVVAELETQAIADAMGTSPGAVEQLLFRARRSLRARLKGDDDDT